MLRYSMSKLGRQAGRAKGTKAELPPIEGRLSTEREYYAALRSMLSEMAKETRESIIPAYQSERTQKRATPALRLDADPSWFNRLSALMLALTRTAQNTVNDILALEAIRHTDTFIEVARRTLGINLRSVVQQEDLGDYLQAAAARNASLIKGLADDTLKGIQLVVYNNSIAGNSVATLRAELQKQFGISDRRARLIARDQSAKMTGELNKLRQEQAGVTEYIFSTSRDERVRANHTAMEGRTCKWGDASVYRADDGSWRSRSGIGGVQLHPGADISCRCVGRGVVRFD